MAFGALIKPCFYIEANNEATNLTESCMFAFSHLVSLASKTIDEFVTKVTCAFGAIWSEMRFLRDT